MYYKKRSTILFRLYDDFGYLTDNRNFGYRNANTPIIGDKVLSMSGAIIINCLGQEALTAEEVAKKAIVEFSGVEYSELLSDILVLFDDLVSDGFLVKSDNVNECNDKALLKPSVRLASDGHLKAIRNLPMSESTQEFLQKHFGDTPFPVSVHIEIAGACNEKCIHCYIPDEVKVGMMSTEMFEKVLDQCRELNILHITLSGGEPLLHPDIIHFLSICRENDMSVNVLSNLTHLTDEMIEEMAKNPLLGVQASLYSTNDDVHNSITGVKGSCEKTKSAILKLIPYGIPVQISCPIMKQNRKDFRGVIDWGSEIGISVSADYVIIGRCDSSTSNLGCRLDEDDVLNILKEDMKDPSYRAKEEEEIRRNRLRTENDYICSVCTSSICVGVKGNVFPCAGWQGCVLGNIKNDSLKNIWFSSEKSVWLRSLKRKDIEKCHLCKYQEYCTLCLVRNANESVSGNPLEVNEFFCKVAQLKKSLYKK